MDELLTPAFFASLVGSEFTVEAAPEAGVEAPVTLVLSHLTEHAANLAAQRTHPFSLLFLGPAGVHLPQLTYTVHHPQAGELHVFLVPMGPLADGRGRYEAVFN